MSAAPIRINLLDWRAAEQEAKRRRFITELVLAALVTILVVGILPVLYYDHRIAEQQARNQYLETQIAAADRQLTEIKSLKKTRDDLTHRMRIISDLQRSRSAIVHYFDQLVATVPDGLYLTSLRQKGDTTTLDGIATSNARVSEYMTNLDASPWFAHPRLIVIKRDDNGGTRRAVFTLEVDSENPDAPSTDDSQTTAAAGTRSAS